MGDYHVDWDEASREAVLRAVDMINQADDINDIYDYIDGIDIFLIDKTDYFKQQTHILLHQSLKGPCLYCMDAGVIPFRMSEYLSLRRNWEILRPFYIDRWKVPNSYYFYNFGSLMQYPSQTEKLDKGSFIEDLNDMVD